MGFSELQSNSPLRPMLAIFLFLSESIPNLRPCAAPERSVIFLDWWEMLCSVFSLLDNPTFTQGLTREATRPTSQSLPLSPSPIRLALVTRTQVVPSNQISCSYWVMSEAR